MLRMRFLSLLMGALLLGPLPARASDTVTTKSLDLKPGVTKVATGRLSGYGSVCYQFQATKGQELTATLTSKNRFLYFNVVPKGSLDVIPATPAPREVTRWSGALPKTGTYEVVVYLVRAEARRGRVATYRLSLKRG